MVREKTGITIFKAPGTTECKEALQLGRKFIKVTGHINSFPIS
jgi:hypothetical protein